jgi:flagellar motor switch protein FliG
MVMEGKMGTLNQLKTMKDAQIQDWLRKVGSDHVDALVLALSGADEEVKNCVMRNMSERASSALKTRLEELATRGVQRNQSEEKALMLEKLL